MKYDVELAGTFEAENYEEARKIAYDMIERLEYTYETATNFFVAELDRNNE